MLFPTHWTFHIVTLGCKINQYESQAIREAWTALGGEEVSLDENPQVFLVNSCAITARGERDTRHALYRLQRQNTVETQGESTPASAHSVQVSHNVHASVVQGSEELQAQLPRPCLRILTGCAAPLVAKTWSLQQKNSYFDVLIPPKAKALLMQNPALWGGQDFFTSQASSCESFSSLSIPEWVNPFGEKGFSIKSFRRARPVLKVQDGCSHGCTYCIVPLVRGKSISRPPMEIVDEAQRLLQAGHSEIMLSGINLHQYGRDLTLQDSHQLSTPVKDFWDLVSLLEKHLAGAWQGKARLRISSLEPSQLSEKGLEVLTSSTLLCAHVHLSLQHGSAAVLKRMGRGHYKIPALQKNVQTLREAWPLMGIGADILMGFAGEREEDVQETLRLVEELGLTYAHVFPYSIRPGTAAEKFTDQVPHAQKMERAARVRQQIEAQQQDFLQRLLQQKELSVVLDGAGSSDSASSGSTGTELVDAHSMNTPTLYKGVEAHYATCQMTLTAQHSGGIVKAKPLRLQGDVLLCEPILSHK